MRQNIDTSPINEMKNTITECIYGNTRARMNLLSYLDSSRSLLSSPYRKLNEISREHIVMSTNASTY